MRATSVAMMRFDRRAALAALILSAALPLRAAEARAPPARVLFVGNSLTAANDLPRLVVALSGRDGEAPSLEAEAITRPGYSLEDHWVRKEALRALERGGWSHVVLQQGPSSLPESRALLVSWSRRFARRAHAAGARPALYMVWPAEARARDFPRVEASYRAAAAATDGVLLPVGAAWRAAWRVDPELALYGPDGFHPAPLGSYLAAVVIEAALTARPPRDGPLEVALPEGPLQVSPELARLLARAADEALGTR